MTPLRVSGELVTFRVVMAMEVKPQGNDSPAVRDDYRQAYDLESYMLGQLATDKLHQRPKLQEEIRASIISDLGSNVDVDDIVIRRGSVELLILVSAAYKLITDFNGFVDTVAKAAENVRRICRGIFAAMLPQDGQARFTSSYTMGSGMNDALERAQEEETAAQIAPVVQSPSTSQTGLSNPNLALSLLRYLVILNLVLIAGIIAVLIWFRVP